ncbi:MAG TPA: KH domain-containing protein [Terriglobales bacterium]|nr:KH domain-containing protein [Terriglobales bacterium]
MANAERLQQWVLETAQLMADHPEAVRVELLGVPERVALRLHVHPSDVGKMIGKQGRTGRALRTIGGAIAMADGKWFTLDIANSDQLAANQ